MLCTVIAVQIQAAEACCTFGHRTLSMHRTLPELLCWLNRNRCLPCDNAVQNSDFLWKGKENTFRVSRTKDIVVFSHEITGLHRMGGPLKPGFGLSGAFPSRSLRDSAKRRRRGRM